MTRITGVEFEEASINIEKLALSGVVIPVIPFKELIVNKMVSGRRQDIADVDELQKIAQFKKKRK